MMLFLWTGPRHCGKTTAAARLARTAGRCGFRVTGILAPSVYRDGYLTGFDVVDLRSQARAPLSVRRDEPGDVGSFHFADEGLKLGARALDVAAAEGADLVIVDEFGPLELASQGWRRAVDSLVQAGKASLLLVVRRELVDAVQEIYADVPGKVLAATAPESVLEVLGWLEKKSQIINHNS
jgi:nucleoside-triphosphatase